MLQESLDLHALLNPEQYEAATTVDGPLLILAGAGSGKTRVLVHRIAHILATGRAEPWQIFAVTFTNKAAREMRTRLTTLIGPEVESAWMGTFHSLCARMLRLEGHRLGYTQSFTIYDSDDSRRLMKSIMKDLQIDASSYGTSVSAIANEIDRAKNKGWGPQELKAATGDGANPARYAANRVYPRYEATLRRSNAMDFGDLLVLAVELLKHHPEAHRRFSRRFRYVLVDEFQDTNVVQYDLLKLLVRDHGNLAVVGDDDQAIYRWRGADVANILGFHRAYPDATVVKLERNYRSTRNILDAANTVVARNTRRHPKRLTTDAGPGSTVGVVMVQNSEDEARLVSQLIAARVRDNSPPSDFAILYRQNAQSRLFEESLRRARVPFTLLGGTAFYERMEVKDILAYLRVTANPASRQDFERIINKPTRGIGDKTLARLRRAGAEADLEGALMLSLPDDVLRGVDLKPAALTKLRQLDRILTELRTMAQTATAEDVARGIVERTGYIRHLERTDPTTAPDRIENVQELVSSIAEHEAALREGSDLDMGSDTNPDGLGLAGARTPLEAFLDLAALTSPDDAEVENGVALLTLHSAKGLEFPTVFMVGMEEMTFPSARAQDSEDAMEEERRLCYVGMTRAERELNLTAARVRRIYGREEVRSPSRFLGELPPEVVGDLPGLALFTGARRQPGLERTPRPERRVVSRGSDRIEYDESAYAPPSSQDTAWQESSEGQPYRPGVRVFHNTFGEGTVEAADGAGRAARLTVRFPTVGIKRIAARFVRFAEDS